jgi:hypothetical protein
MRGTRNACASLAGLDLSELCGLPGRFTGAPPRSTDLWPAEIRDCSSDLCLRISSGSLQHAVVQLSTMNRGYALMASQRTSILGLPILASRLSALVITAVCAAASGAAADIVYDNTTNFVSVGFSTAPGFESGSVVTLAGSQRTVTEFEFAYRGPGFDTDGDETARIRFRLNDGPAGQPGTIIYDSGQIAIVPAFDETVSLTNLSVAVPDTFTWTVEYGGISGIDQDRVLNLVHSPATIGDEGGKWIFNTILWLDQTDRAGLYARITAITGSTTAGLPCSGTVCGLGGQIRSQIGEAIPFPISIVPGQTGPFQAGTSIGAYAYNNAVVHTQPITLSGNPQVGQGLGQPGQIKAKPGATVMQTLGAAPRAITLPPAQFGYGPQAGSIALFNFNLNVFAGQTNLIIDYPHPGTDGVGNVVAVPGGGGSRMLSRGFAGGGTINQGRPGLPTVSFYAGATANGSPGNNYGNGNPPGAPMTAMAGDAAGINGVARFVATRNQFGGISTGRTLGTVKGFYNLVGAGLSLFQVPCTGTAMCAFQIGIIPIAVTGVTGGPFGSTVNVASFTTPTGAFTGTIGFNGTILGIGNPVTTGSGLNIPFTLPSAMSIGFPATTGRLSITVTSVSPTERFVRTGTDARDANGSGVIALVTGSMSKRSLLGPLGGLPGSANRTWITLEILEPSAILSASAGLFALFGCHQLVRRRLGKTSRVHSTSDRYSSDN